MNTILIADDDAVICRNLSLALGASGYRTVTASTAADAAAFAAGTDLILLDVMFPDGSGFDCCKEIRRSSDVPVIFLTSCSEEEEIVRGLDAGADDYITKPFRLGELLSRIQANLRRCGKNQHQDDLTALNLTAAEEKLLRLLMQHAGQYLTRDQILAALWDAKGNFVSDNTLSVHISRLREKISSAAFGEIRTKRGLGYCWVRSAEL
ncbi:MAG TPA: DNA-binding response regulator [Ruminococcus sp.]|nr:DNA-binding response regulator [Ruminococcus sp.]